MRLLRDHGYTNVKHYSGGIREWLDRGLPLESGPAAEASPDRRSPPVARPLGLGRGPEVVGGPASPSQGLHLRLKPVRWGRSVVLLDALGERSVGQLLGFWLAMVVLFAAGYWALAWAGVPLHASGRTVGLSLRGFLRSLYFSFVTALSVGYGDVVPVGFARVMAVAEAGLGLLVFGGVVSKFVSRRQEQLIQEIHRTTFLDRLARVRTNLHMVLSELHTMIELCSERRPDPEASFPPASGADAQTERLMIRIESVSLVFLGELRAVHDLLYRPQQVPDEAILEGLLAELAAVMGELGELCRCLPAGVNRSPTLEAAVRSVAEMALEICGDCVPRQYAPHLRVWMDRVQELGRTLETLWPASH